MTQNDSLQGGAGAAHAPPTVSFPLERLGTPVQGKPDTFTIEGEEIGPDSWFGSGADPTDREGRLMKKYVLLKAHDFRCKIPGYDEQLWPDEVITRYLEWDNIPQRGESAAGWFPMDIDRVDGNHRHREGSNLRMACHSHNAIYGNTGQRRGAGALADPREEEKEKSSNVTPTDKRILDLSRGYEAAGRTFIFELLLGKKHEKVEPDTARVKMRNEIGCSRATSYGIMERLVGDKDDDGFPLYAARDPKTGAVSLNFHNENCYNMKIEQINKAYPARGYITQKGVTFE